LAAVYVGDPIVAEEVAQDAWVGALTGLARFEGRSSLKTWLFRILTNIAKTRAERERRSVPFSALMADEHDNEPAVDAARFHARGELRGHWVEQPSVWSDLDEGLDAQETRVHIEQALQQLPPAQRQVIMLRDIEGWTSDEVCNALGLSETNQRVLLHRARSKVRAALADYLTRE
jgi:RNA polymerase sigma-70 factor, ECF subfamily